MKQDELTETIHSTSLYRQKSKVKIMSAFLLQTIENERPQSQCKGDLKLLFSRNKNAYCSPVTRTLTGIVSRST